MRMFCNERVKNKAEIKDNIKLKYTKLELWS